MGHWRGTGSQTDEMAGGHSIIPNSCASCSCQPQHGACAQVDKGKMCLLFLDFCGIGNCSAL